MSRKTLLALCTTVLCLGAAAAPQARAAGDVTCKMNYTLTGWSVIYKHAEGKGTVHCSNGQTMPVHITAKGGGLSFGKSTLNNGHGEFAGVHDIKDVLGSYATAEAHAGAVKSSGAQAMTKGEVSLAISGTGEGWDIGIAFGKFTIEPR